MIEFLVTVDATFAHLLLNRSNLDRADHVQEQLKIQSALTFRE